METTYLQELTGSSIDAFIHALDAFSDDQLNVVPFEGSWTAGQVGRHMVMSDTGFLQLIQGPVKDTDRDPMENFDQIKNDFLNFEVKMTSPDFVVPVLKKYQKDRLISSLSAVRTGLHEAIASLDLSKTCTIFELPFYGHLTRLEAISFITYHTKRHTHQLSKIATALGM